MRHHKAGFTLVELVVAFLILTVGVVAILELVGQSALNARYAQDKTTATTLAQQKLEELLAQPNLEVGETEGDFGDRYPQFRWRAQVSEVATNTSSLIANPSSLPLLRLSVVVEWRYRRRGQSVQLETLQSAFPLLHPQEAAMQQTEDMLPTVPGALPMGGEGQ